MDEIKSSGATGLGFTGVCESFFHWALLDFFKGDGRGWECLIAMACFAPGLDGFTGPWKIGV